MDTYDKYMEKVIITVRQQIRHLKPTSMLEYNAMSE